MPKKSNTLATYELQFNVAQLLKENMGVSREYDIHAEVGMLLDEDVKTASPLVGQIRLLRTGPNILVTGLLECIIRKSCGRCLTIFTASVSIELEEEFYPTIDINTGAAAPEPVDADEANRINEQNIIDLSEVVRQELVVAADGILYCKADCKGLCPHCGQDRNFVVCDCADQHIDSRWAGLQTLQIVNN